MRRRKKTRIPADNMRKTKVWGELDKEVLRLGDEKRLVGAWRFIFYGSVCINKTKTETLCGVPTEAEEKGDLCFWKTRKGK